MLQIDNDVTVRVATLLGCRRTPRTLGSRQACEQIERALGCIRRIVSRKDALSDANVTIGSGQFTYEASIDVAPVEADGIVGHAAGTYAAPEDELQVAHLGSREADVLLVLAFHTVLMCQQRPVLVRLHAAIHPVLRHIAAVCLAFPYVAEDEAVHFVDARELQDEPRLLGARVAPLAARVDVAHEHVGRTFALGSIAAAGVDEATHLARADTCLLTDDTLRHLHAEDRVAFVEGCCRVADCHADERIGTAVVEEPFTLMVDKPLGKDRAGRILSALLEGVHRPEEGFVEAVEEHERILSVEEHLPCCISVGGITAVAIIAAGVLAVVDKHDAICRTDCRRAALGEQTVEEPLARLHQIEQFLVCVHDGRPGDEVVARCAAHPALAPVHEVLLLAADHYLRGLQASVFHLCHDGPRLAEHIGELAVVCRAETRAVVRPRPQVATGGHAQTGNGTVPRREGHHVERLAVHFGLHYTRVLRAARPFVFLRDGRLVGVHDGRRRTVVYRDAVGTLHQTDARGAFANAHIRVVLGAVEHTDLAILLHGGRVERVGTFPPDLCLLHGAVEEIVGERAHHRVFAFRARKTADSPLRQHIGTRRALLVVGHSSEADEQDGEKEYTSHSVTLLLIK